MQQHRQTTTTTQKNIQRPVRDGNINRKLPSPKKFRSIKRDDTGAGWREMHFLDMAREPAEADSEKQLNMRGSRWCGAT
jgi:hypothetical protein